MSKATEELMAKLHGKVVQAMIDKIENGEATASDLAAAAKMLKDNGITVDADMSPDVQRLSDSLPDLDADPTGYGAH